MKAMSPFRLPTWRQTAPAQSDFTHALARSLSPEPFRILTRPGGILVVQGRAESPLTERPPAASSYEAKPLQC